MAQKYVLLHSVLRIYCPILRSVWAAQVRLDGYFFKKDMKLAGAGEWRWVWRDIKEVQ